MLPIEERGSRRQRWLVAVVELTADELEGIASALGPNDAGGQEMYDTADEIRRREERP